MEVGHQGHHDDDSLYYPYGLTITREDTLLVSDQVKHTIDYFIKFALLITFLRYINPLPFIPLLFSLAQSTLCPT